MESTYAPSIGLVGKVARFALHFFEMCLPMCIGFAIGDAIYFAIASAFGYSEPFAQLPVLSVFVVTFSMTAPMTAWMVYRGMPRKAVREMTAVMPIVAAILLLLGWLGVIAMDNLALVEHGLMMPAMLIPMLWRANLYAAPMHHRAVRRASARA